MKTRVALVALTMAAACAASNSYAQQIGYGGIEPVGYFQEAESALHRTADMAVAGQSMSHAIALGGGCGASACGDGCDMGCGDCGQMCCDSCCCCDLFCHRTGLWGEVIVLRPRDTEIAIAVPGQAPVVAGGLPVLPVPQGQTVILDPDYQPGFRVGAALALDNRTSVVMQYTNFESQTENSRQATAAELQQNLNIFPLLLHPLAQLPNNVTNVAAAGNLDIDFDIIDLGGRMLLWNSESIAVNGLGGVRWAHMDQDVLAAYTINGGTIIQGSSQYDGLGALLGLDGEYRSRGGFGAYAKTSLSLLYGAGRGDYHQFQLNNRGNPQVFTNGKYDRLSPLWDFETGLQWLSPEERLRLSVGYMTNVWFNIITARDYINGIRQSQFDDFSDTVTFDGLTARVEVRF